VSSKEETSRIEELKKSLYSRSAPDVRTRRKLRFDSADAQIPKEWQPEPEEEKVEPLLNTAYEDHSMSFFSKLLIGALAFFVVAVGLGLFLFFKGANFISANNIEITVSGPVSIAGGELATFDIRVVNKNNVDLELADLSVDFPAGTTDPDDPTKELKTYRELIGDLPKKGFAIKTVSAIIFGEENLQKGLEITLTYKVKGSTALFTKKTSYDVLISSSPINLSIDSPKEITSGQEFELKVKLRSNSDETLKNVLLKAQYPFGFSFISSNIKPVGDNRTWRIGDIPPGGERVITIQSKLTGEDTDMRVLRFTVGAQSNSDPNVIGTEYIVSEQHISIQKPFIALGISVDGDDGTEFNGEFDHSSQVRISWMNSLPVAVSNLQITAKLRGSAYDKNSVNVGDGFFRSVSDEVIWNQQTNPKLEYVSSGDQGTVAFSVTPRDLSTPSKPVVNPMLIVDINVTGNRTQESNVVGSLNSTMTANIRIPSLINLTGRVLRTVGPFENVGPMPPQADKESTYTIIWSVDNTWNALDNARVVATLPPNVRWLDKYTPATERVSYDPNSNTVIWDVGGVGTYTTGSTRRREMVFQVSIEPNVNHIGQAPTLINEAVLTAVDNFTRTTLQSSQEFLTTRFSTDPGYREGDEMVVR